MESTFRELLAPGYCDIINLTVNKRLLLSFWKVNSHQKTRIALRRATLPDTWPDRRDATNLGFAGILVAQPSRLLAQARRLHHKTD